MTQSAAINIQPNDVTQICGRVADLATQALTVARAVQAMRVPASAYGQIGDAAASASEHANQAVGQTIQQLSALLQAITGNVVSAANQSARWDTTSGQSLSALSAAALSAAAQPTAATAGTAA